MSWTPLHRAGPGGPDGRDAAPPMLILPRTADIGGFEVRRALPSPQRQMVGPFIFFDQFGPAEFVTGAGLDVRPHPHIGLGTVTYLHEGSFEHRDSLGTRQTIRPGEVNWMVAGRGVTHSERTGPEERGRPSTLTGIQTWMALPADAEDMAPVFEHHGRADLPLIEDKGVTARLILGHAFGSESPVTMLSEAFYLDVTLAPGAAVPLPDDHEDRGIHVLEGEISVAGDRFESGRMMVFRPGDRIGVTAGPRGARIMMLGGATLNETRYIWWNFVSSSKERIAQARADWTAADWENGPFRLPPGDAAEHVPIDPWLRNTRPKEW